MSAKNPRLAVGSVLLVLSTACATGTGIFRLPPTTTGPEVLEVPNVVDLNVAEAKTTLRTHGFRVRQVKEHSPEPKGTVLSQEPGGGDHVEPGTLVTVTTALGTVIVPRVTGLPYSQARATLRDLGLVVKRTSELSSNGPGELVRAQSLPEGSFARGGRVVTLTVTTLGVLVPDVTGMSVFEAELTLLDANLKTRILSPGADGAVLDQSPNARTLVRPGTRVTLTVGDCDPNYSGCLDPNALDYDCAGGSGNGPLYTGTVRVLGFDHYGLDADGDGYGCE